MAICPQCLTEIPETAGACVGCGRPRYSVAAPADSVSVTVAPATIILKAALPAPMVEPIRPPLTPSPDRSRPTSFAGIATPSFGGSGSVGPDRLRKAVALATPSDDVVKPYHDPATPDSAALTACSTPPVASDATDRSPPPPPPPAIRPKLVVLRGQRVGQEFPVYGGRNLIGRFADKPVDIDLIAQEAEGQIWSSRQHAAVTFDKNLFFVEDLNSLNGTWLNGARIHPGQQRMMKPGDVIQVGTVQLKLMVD